MKVLIACEESQTVCKAFRELGHEAYSNDIQECSGRHPEWHLNMDCFQAIELMDWDLMIAHPPCTHLAVSGARWFEEKKKDGRQQEAIDFFLKLTDVKIKHWAIENPVCIMSKHYRKPDQIIQPYYFGDKSRKTTCLWLNGLPLLMYGDTLFCKTNIVEPDIYVCKNGKTFSRDYMVSLSAGNDRAKIRSRTFPGIAQAMATQWSKYIIESSGR